MKCSGGLVLTCCNLLAVIAVSHGDETSTETTPVKCSEGCDSCSEFNGCESCKRQYTLLLHWKGSRQTGECVVNCPPGYYANVDRTNVKYCANSSCYVGEWSAWSTCTRFGRTCGYKYGTKTRVREEIYPYSLDDEKLQCPSTLQTKKCLLQTRRCRSNRQMQPWQRKCCSGLYQHELFAFRDDLVLLGPFNPTYCRSKRFHMAGLLARYRIKIRRYRKRNGRKI